MHIAKLGFADFTINNFQIINETIVERDEQMAHIIDSLNSLEPSIAQKVIEQMTPNELRALAGLQPIQEQIPQA
jgi:hypothetical protein